MSYRIEKGGYGYICPECGGQVLFASDDEPGMIAGENNHQCNVCPFWTAEPEKECEKEYYEQERFCPSGN